MCVVAGVLLDEGHIDVPEAQLAQGVGVLQLDDVYIGAIGEVCPKGCDERGDGGRNAADGDPLPRQRLLDCVGGPPGEVEHLPGDGEEGCAGVAKT